MDNKYRPITVAEIGSSWKLPTMAESKALAIAAAKQAADAGAGAVKYQIFRSDTLFSQTRAPKQHAAMHELELPLAWLPEIQLACKDNGIELWASVFDPLLAEYAGEYCDSLKIASGDINNYPLIETVLDICQGNDIGFSFSTGASTADEVWAVIKRTYQYAPCEVGAFSCVSTYPCPQTDYALDELSEFEMSVHWIGLSDHTKSFKLAQMALAHGSYSVFEKHVQPDGCDPKNAEASVAATMKEFAAYIEGLESAYTVTQRGRVKTVKASEERERLWIRRGLDGLRPMEDADGAQ